MKIKIKEIAYYKLPDIKRSLRKKPLKPNPALKKIINMLSKSDLNKLNFKADRIGMDKLGRDEPCLILMNHSSFIDLEIASVLLYPRPYQIVCTTDGFIGKETLMRLIGCIPTQKFYRK